MPIRIFHFLLLFISLLSITACGGGGGGTVNDGAITPPSNSPQEQSISFSQTGTIELFVGEILTTTASAPSTGALEFSLADSGIVSVDNSGTLTALSAGETTLTLTAAADDTYLAATLAIPVKVSKRPTKLELSATAVAMAVEESTSLQVVSNSDSNIIFTSSDAELAQVDATGKITALMPGTTEILVTTQETAAYLATQAIVKLTISLKNPNLGLEQGTEISGFVHDTLSNTASSNSAGQISYQSANESVVAVDAQGQITLKGAGTTTVLVSQQAHGKFASASIQYTVTSQLIPQSVTFEQAGPFSKRPGDVVLNPAAASSGGGVTYLVSNPQVASVTPQGEVTLLADGSVTISAETPATSAYQGAVASYVINSEYIQRILEFSQTAEQLLVGEQLNASASAEGPGSISYTSSKPSIASVDANGLVTAHTKGNTVISATVAAQGAYGPDSANFALSVKLHPQVITFEHAGAMLLEVDDISSNTASAEGSGIISYSSSNPAVASIDDQGSILALAAGTSTMTATVAADDHFDSASVEFALTVELKSQTLSFPQQEIKTLTGKQVSNAASGAQGSGTLSYESDNPSVAAVDAHGLVTVVSAGSAIISAHIEADTSYQSATASYQIQSVNSNVSYVAWSGSDSAELYFDAGATGLAMGASNQLECTFDGAEACTNGSKNIIGDASFSIPSLKAYSRAYLNFQFGDYQASTSNSSLHWSGRYLTKIIAANDELYLVGGKRSVGTVGDVWRSADGISWERRLFFLSGFNPDGLHALASRSGHLYVYGGEFNEAIWKSTNQGLSWSKVTNNAVFGRRKLPSVVELNNDLYLLGGANAGNNPVQDVWHSTDGENWALVTNTVNFPAKALATEFNGKIWMLGSNGSNVNIQSSANGADWTSHNNNASFEIASDKSSLVAHNGKLWVIEGSTNRVWSSPDGSAWSQEADLPHSNLLGATAVSFNNQLLIYGGAIDSEKNVSEYVWRNAQDSWQLVNGHHYSVPALGFLLANDNQFWSITHSDGATPQTHTSSDSGTHWQYVTSAPETQEETDTVMLGNTPWVIATNHQNGAKSHYLDANGQWVPVAETPAFSARTQATILSKDNKLWLFGGKLVGSSTKLDDIWSSTDGVHWTFEGNYGPLARTNKGVAVFNDAFWLVGGTNFPTHYKEIHSSSDGINWTKEVDDAPFGYRLNSGLFSFKNKLWLVGGYHNVSGLTLHQDIWSSSDGVSWVQEASTSAMGNIMSPSIAVQGNTVLMTVGSSQQDTRFNGLWRSEDGVNWSRYIQQNVFLE